MDSVFVADRCDSLREGGFANFFVSMLVTQSIGHIFISNLAVLNGLCVA